MISSAKIASLLGLRLVLALIMPIASVSAIASPARSQPPGVNPAGNQALTVRSDIQEADSKTGIVTARGNVRINYPSRQMQATAAQAQYFSRERRIVLMGDAYVLQDGNSLRAETITYLIDEGRFIAVPENNQQVESVYFIPPASP